LSKVSSLPNIVCNRTTQRSFQNFYQSGEEEADAAGILGTCVVVCCSVLQRVAVGCSVLQCVAQKKMEWCVQEG